MNDPLNTSLTEPVSELAYRLRPAQAGAGRAPCLILLHGVGANELGFIELAKRMDPRLAVVLARGPLAFGPSQFGWFQVRFTASGPAIDPVQAEQSRLKLLDFIGQLPQLHAIDPARLWIAGFSQGGIMSASVGLTAPERVAGFGILSGRILPEVLPLVQRSPALKQVRAFVSHGVQDDKLGIHFGRNASQVLDVYEVPLDYREYAAGHTLTTAMVDDFRQWLAAQL